VFGCTSTRGVTSELRVRLKDVKGGGQELPEMTNKFVSTPCVKQVVQVAWSAVRSHESNP